MRSALLMLFRIRTEVLRSEDNIPQITYVDGDHFLSEFKIPCTPYLPLSPLLGAFSRVRFPSALARGTSLS